MATVGALAALVVAACGDDGATIAGTGGDAPSATNSGGLSWPSDLARAAGPLPGTQYSAAMVPEADGTFLFAGWDTADGSGFDPAQPAAGVPTIVRHDPSSGVDTTLVVGGFAPVPLAGGGFAYARTDGEIVGPLSLPASDVVVRDAGGEDEVVFAGDGRNAYPVFAVGDGLLVQVEVASILETYLVTGQGERVKLGLPLAMSPDSGAVLTTVADGAADELLILTDGEGRTLASIDRDAYVDAFLEPEHLGLFDPDAPIDGYNPVPIAPSGIGAWAGETIVLPASPGLMWLESDGTTLSAVGFTPLDDTLDPESFIVQVGRVWALGDDTVMVNAVIVDIRAAQPARPAPDMSRQEAEEAAEESAAAYADALEERTYRCSVTERRCEQSEAAVAPPWFTFKEEA